MQRCIEWLLTFQNGGIMSKCIIVHYDSKPIYDIIIEHDFCKLPECIHNLGIKGRKLCIVTDSNVGKLYCEAVKNELEKTDNTVMSYTFEAGEEHKNLDTVQDIYEFLIQNRFDRNDILVALGGGVVGDLTGFTAASYLRGIDFIQIPTSLLAQVDSSIGGKTGVDFRAYKNMVGAFHQPKLVYMNTCVLKTLDKRLFNSGFGEILKHGLIKDMAYFQWLDDNSSKINALDNHALEEMIAKSCNIKRVVVENDPTEKGERALLNFGHTLGHAIEKLTNFSLYHGECVVLGMVAALNICVSKEFISTLEYQKIIDTFKSYDFSLTVNGISKEDIIRVSKNDKKMDSGQIKFILLKQCGEAYIDKTITDDDMRKALDGMIQ